ncbi:HPC2-domain-containing protein [Hyaloscypha bicolor E]|uniref:HPC2-domain-containing protein n=1 Tax=Hyaloscypha bicolor E TaxID=1095630 RepID=A0A2J6TW22_9HELO|nr:HPC2-domain-containing protein [Hyaloscypha bicolor E]PMD67223.1 HPC2-domain-containing protein [Hyaloscypha bicolor E]
MIRRNMSTERVRQLEDAGVGARGVSPGQFSSASGLSSPPRSSPEPASPSAQFANESNSNQISSITVNPPGVVVENSAEKPARRKPGRKPGSVNKPKNNADSSATNTDAPKVRKPRKPRDPNAPPIQRRKRNAGSDANSVVEIKTAAGVPRPPQAVAEALPDFHVPASVPTQQAQKGKNEDIQRPIQSFFSNAPPPPPPQQAQPQQAQPQQPARTSGQNYDPIRSNFDPVRETVVTHNSYNNSQGSPSHPHSMNRASASPSISSLVDPPNQALTSPSIAAQSFFNQQQQQQQQQARFHNEGHTSVPPSPTANRLAPSAIVEPCTQKPPTPVAMAVKKQDIAPAPGPTTISKKGNGPGSTATSSAAASPKPHKLKEPKELYPTPPPLPGSGLMQLGGAGAADGAEFRAPTVILQIPLNGEVNKYVNFTRLAEERYGWDALHPRLAAQRDRLARVAAAGAALERNGSNKDSGDEMSLDSEAEGSNIEMGGMSDGRTGTDGGAKRVPKKRKMKEDEYDKDDGFVDDSELLWEEQAAAANDGFFVYSGPLVPEGEKPALDIRADGAPKRGRGRGSRGGARASSGRGGAAALAASTGLRPNGLPLSGPGSRGGSTTRKPRITKADRARMEQEKLDREKMGSMTQIPGNYGGGMAQLASAPNLGNTPMVFNQ